MNSKKIGRFTLSEITPDRLANALKVRLHDLPHTIAWNTSPLAWENKESIRKFKDIHLHKRCFIVANGPSLKNTNLDLLQNEITFGLNRIYLFFENTKFRPTYFVSVNELVLEQFAEEISQLQMPKFINWSARSYYGLPGPNVIYLNRKNVIHDSFHYDLTQPMMFGATVTFVALQLAYYMGFRQVILVGLDHNFVEKGTPNTVEVRKEVHDENHFNAQYFPKGIKWQLPDLQRSEIDYEIARKAFELDGREIVDATIGGKCNVFKKADFYSLVNKA